MPTLSSLQLPPPRHWQDFEIFCCDLWRAIWKDANAQRNGRQGQAQHGVDVYGRPNQGSTWAGVQCKGKDTFSDQNLTEKELRDEVEKAKGFHRTLAEYTIATTAPRDATVQSIAGEITDQHRASNFFSVHVWSWEDIVESLEFYPDVVAKHYPQFTGTPRRRSSNEEASVYDQSRSLLHAGALYPERQLLTDEFGDRLRSVLSDSFAFVMGSTIDRVASKYLSTTSTGTQRRVEDLLDCARKWKLPSNPKDKRSPSERPDNSPETHASLGKECYRDGNALLAFECEFLTVLQGMFLINQELNDLLSHTVKALYYLRRVQACDPKVQQDVFHSLFNVVCDWLTAVFSTGNKNTISVHSKLLVLEELGSWLNERGHYWKALPFFDRHAAIMATVGQEESGYTDHDLGRLYRQKSHMYLYQNDSESMDRWLHEASRLSGDRQNAIPIDRLYAEYWWLNRKPERSYERSRELFDSIVRGTGGFHIPGFTGLTSATFHGEILVSSLMARGFKDWHPEHSNGLLLCQNREAKALVTRSPLVYSMLETIGGWSSNTEIIGLVNENLMPTMPNDLAEKATGLLAVV